MILFIKKVLPKPIFNILKQFKDQQTLKKYKGNNVYCPLCNNSFLKFAPHKKKRDNAKCPKCGSLERHRLLYLYLKESNLISSDKKTRLLHFAPEKVFFQLLSSNSNIEYFPCDFDYEKYHGKVIEMDITDIKFSADYFDVIICNHVLEHIPDDMKAMRELNRVLKPDGFSILQVPIDYTKAHTYEDFSITKPKEREKAFGQHDHVRIYGKDYADRLTKAGFKVKEDHFVQQFSDEDIKKYGLSKKEIIYICKK